MIDARPRPGPPPYPVAAGDRLKISSPTLQVKKGTRVTLKLAVPRKAQKAIRKALRKHSRVEAMITVTVKDAAGNSAVHKRTIKLRR